MAWICLTPDISHGGTCAVVNGLWNGQGLAYMSIADEIIQWHDRLIDYLLQITPITYGILMACAIGLFLFSLFYAINRKVKKIAGNN